MNKEVTLTLNNKEVTVKRMALGKYTEVFTKLQELPPEIGTVLQTEGDQMITKLPLLVATFLPEVIKILSIATPVSEKELNEEYGLDEAVQLLGAVLEVNNIAQVIESAKKIMAQNKTAQPTPKK